MDIRETSIDDVLNSRMIADPLRLLDCCMISDGAERLLLLLPRLLEIVENARFGYLDRGKQQSTRHSKPILLQVQLLSQDRGRLEKQVYLLGR